MRRHVFGRSRRRQQIRRHAIPRLIGADFIQCHARQYRRVLSKQRVDACKSILVLDQQPLILGRGSHERERTFQLLAAQKNTELAVLVLASQTIFCFLAIAEAVLTALIRRIHPAIPHDHIARAVLLLRDHTFERCVIEWMVFDVHRETLLADLQRRPFRYRPRFQYAIKLQPKVIVQPPRRMLLHDEQQRPTPPHHLRPRLGRPGELALGGVLVEWFLHLAEKISTGITGSTGMK